MTPTTRPSTSTSRCSTGTATAPSQLLRADPHRRALLLERLHPERPDRAVGPRGLRGRGRPLRRGSTCRRCRSCARSRRTSSAGPTSSAALPRDAPIPRRLVEQALSLGRDLVADPASDGRIIHGDLHYENVLAARPRAVAGDRPQADVRRPALRAGADAVEPLGRGGRLRATSGTRVRRRFHTLVDAAGLDEDRARDWVVVRMVLNAMLVGPGRRTRRDRAARRRSEPGVDHPAAIAIAQGRPGLKADGPSAAGQTGWLLTGRPDRRRIGAMCLSVVSVNVGTPREARLGRHRPHLDRQAAGGRSGARRAGSGSRATRSPTPGTTAASTRRSTRSPARTWTAGRASSARTIRDGQFGENLTTAGIDVNEAEVGERWRIGTALLEVASVRIPCNDFKSWMGRCGYDNRAWVQAVHRARPARALPAGARGGHAAGRRRDRRRCTGPGHGVTVSHDVPGADHRAATLLPELLGVDGLVAEARARRRETSRPALSAARDAVRCHAGPDWS